MKFDLYLGYVAAFLTTFAFLPQVYKAHKTKHTKDLSIYMYVLFSTGVFLWMVYGIMIHAMPVVVANATTLVLALYILFLKIRHG